MSFVTRPYSVHDSQPLHTAACYGSHCCMVLQPRLRRKRTYAGEDSC